MLIYIHANTQKIPIRLKWLYYIQKKTSLFNSLYDANLSFNCLLQSIIINAVSFGISKANKNKENEQ